MVHWWLLVHSDPCNNWKENSNHSFNPFELFVIYLLLVPKFFMKLKICKIPPLSDLNHRPLKSSMYLIMWQCTHTRLSHKLKRKEFIVFYNCYVSKISEFKNPSAKVKILKLINYSIVCCQIQSREYTIGQTLQKKHFFQKKDL